MSLNNLFLSTFSRFPGKTAFKFAGREVRFGELEAKAGQIAWSLKSLGLERGERAAVFLPNGIDLILAHLGIGFAGAVRVPLNPAYGERELRHILEDSRVKLVFSHPELYPRLNRLGLEGLEAVIVGNEEWVRLGPGGTGEFLSSGEEYFDAEVNDDAPAMIAYTSGTTGLAKGAVISHGNLRSNIETLTRVWDWTDADRLLLTLPLFHIHGLGLGVHGVLAAGCSCILEPKFAAEEVLSVLNNGEATLFMGVPTMYHRLAGVPEPSRFDLSPVRLFISGSAALPPALFEKFQDLFGHEILERYGLTETIMNTSNPVEGMRKPGSVGLPLPGVEVRVMDEEGAFLDPGETGEVVIQGPNVFKGYLNRPEATEEAFRGEFFRTGDLGFFDREGYLTLAGRRSELIISGGYNVYPREVEEEILTFPGIAEAAVVGREDPELGEKVWAFAVLQRDKSVEYQELKSFLQGRIADYKIPKGLTVIKELPRNAMGKVVKKELVS